MSDEMFEEEETTAEEQPQPGKKKIGFLPAVVIDMLKWAAIIIGAIIFIVVVVVITVRSMNKGSQATSTRIPLESPYDEGGAELLDWFSNIGDVRGTTQDEVRKTYIVSPYIGYEPESEATLQELIQREIQLKEVISMYFSSRKITQLQGVDNRQRVKRELREEINKIMINDVREVAFDRYEFIDF